MRRLSHLLVLTLTGSVAPSAFATEDSPLPQERAAADAHAVFARTEAEIQSAESWARRGVLIPALAGATLSIITQPGGKTDVSVWQSASLASLFGFSGFWGVSMGHYRAGRPGYATLSGLGRMALFAGGLGLDEWTARRCDDGQVCDTIPVGSVLGLVAVIAWSAWDYQRLDSVVRNKPRTEAWTALPMITASRGGGLRADVVGRF